MTTARMHRANRPVFLDPSGWRRRLLQVSGAVAGAALLSALVLLILSFAGASPIPLPGLPDARRNLTRTVCPRRRPGRPTRAA
jgi:hypothetical protein